MRTWPPPTKRSGGFIAFRKGKVAASLPTPLNGLATDKPFKRGICSPAQAARSQARHACCTVETPQMKCVSLVTIPYYRICTKPGLHDRGIVSSWPNFRGWCRDRKSKEGE
jgi:adenine deaminase